MQKIFANTMEIIEKLREKINSEGVTPYRVAVDIGVNPSVITRILNGETKNPNSDTLEKINNYLHANYNANDLNEITAIELRRLRNELLLTQEDFAKKLGVSRRFIGDWEEGRIIPNKKSEVFQKLAELMQSFTSEKKNESYEDDPIINSSGNRFYLRKDGLFDLVVDEVPFPAHGKYLAQDEEYYADWEKETFVVDRIGHGNYLGFKHVGESMYNPDEPSEFDIKEGGKSLGRELNRWHWQDGFNPKRALLGWVLITKKNILHKDILDFDVNTGTIKLGSRNPNPKYAPFEMSINDVYQIFKIVKKK